MKEVHGNLSNLLLEKNIRGQKKTSEGGRQMQKQYPI